MKFAEQLHNGAIVISFNWDGLLEIALCRVGKRYTYNFSDETAIKLCKLQGSVNWRPNKWGWPTNTLGWESLNFTKGIMEREIYHTPALLNYLAWQRYSPLGEL